MPNRGFLHQTKICKRLCFASIGSRAIRCRDEGHFIKVLKVMIFYILGKSEACLKWFWEQNHILCIVSYVNGMAIEIINDDTHLLILQYERFCLCNNCEVNRQTLALHLLITRFVLTHFEYDIIFTLPVFLNIFIYMSCFFFLNSFPMKPFLVRMNQYSCRKIFVQ